jgi:hypothetical protein
MTSDPNRLSWFHGDDQAPSNQSHSSKRRDHLPVHQEEERVADQQQSRLSRLATELHHLRCPPARTFCQMFGANKFAQITETSTKARTTRQRSPSRFRQALDTSTHDHIIGEAVGTGVSEQHSFSQSCHRAEIAQRERIPTSFPAKCGANSFRMRQETSGQAAPNNDRAEIVLNPGASQLSQSRTNVNTTPRQHPPINTQPLPQSTEKPRAQRTKPTRMQGAASFPLQRTKQPPTQHTNQLHSPGENQPRSQSTAQPYHLPKKVVQPNQAEHKYHQQTKQSRQQQAERIHIQRMAQNRAQYAAQPHLQPNQQNNQQSAEHALHQCVEQPHPQHEDKQRHDLREQQRLSGADRPQPQAHVQSHPQRVKQLRALFPEQANDQLLERPSVQCAKQSRDRLADVSLPQPTGDPYRERTDSVHSQPQQQSSSKQSDQTGPQNVEQHRPKRKQSDQTGPQNVEQHRPKRKQPPPTLRPKLSSTSIEVQPPTPQRQQAASSPSSELPTLSSLNVSQIPPEPHTRSKDEVWIDSVNRQNSTTASVLKEAAEKFANQSSHMSRYDTLGGGMEHLRHSRSFSSMVNVGTERRGSWANLKIVARKASGLMKRLHDPAGGPLGKK